jgi:hypothetical protein
MIVMDGYGHSRLREFVLGGATRGMLESMTVPVLTGLCSLLGVAIEPRGSSLSFRVAIRRVGGFVLVVLAHSMQSLFYAGCSRSTGLRMEQLREFE